MTKIQWVRNARGEPGMTVNPIRFRNLKTMAIGHHCVKISPGCKNCYASTMNGGPYLSGLTFIAENRDKGEFFLDDQALNQVLRRRKPTAYFWCDMTDLFGEWVPDEWITAVMQVIEKTPQHRPMILTKRAERLPLFFNLPRETGDPWPLEALWLGVSVEDRERKSRIGYLRQVPAAVRFLSLEPLLEDPGPLDLSGIHWVIVGGESGPGARPCDVAWIRSIVQQCEAAEVSCFVKQLGAHIRASGLSAFGWPINEVQGLWSDCSMDPPRIHVNDHKGGDPSEWPEDLRVRQMPYTQSLEEMKR